MLRTVRWINTTGISARRDKPFRLGAKGSGFSSAVLARHYSSVKFEMFLIFKKHATGLCNFKMFQKTLLPLQRLCKDGTGSGWWCNNWSPRFVVLKNVSIVQFQYNYYVSDVIIIPLRRVMYSTIPVTQSQTRLTDMKFYMSFEFCKHINLIHYIRIILPKKSRCAPATFG